MRTLLEFRNFLLRKLFQRQHSPSWTKMSNLHRQSSATFFRLDFHVLNFVPLVLLLLWLDVNMFVYSVFDVTSVTQCGHTNTQKTLIIQCIQTISPTRDMHKEWSSWCCPLTGARDVHPGIVPSWRKASDVIVTSIRPPAWWRTCVHSRCSLFWRRMWDFAGSRAFSCPEWRRMIN